MRSYWTWTCSVHDSHCTDLAVRRNMRTQLWPLICPQPAHASRVLGSILGTKDFEILPGTFGTYSHCQETSHRKMCRKATRVSFYGIRFWGNSHTMVEAGIHSKHSTWGSSVSEPVSRSLIYVVKERFPHTNVEETLDSETNIWRWQYTFWHTGTKYHSTHDPRWNQFPKG